MGAVCPMTFDLSFLCLNSHPLTFTSCLTFDPNCSGLCPLTLDLDLVTLTLDLSSLLLMLPLPSCL